MSFTVPRNVYIITQEQRDIISERYKRVTAAINNALWHTASDTSHSFYVGSYGRHTAIDTSDIDILVEVPESFLVKNVLLSSSYNPQSRLLQVVKQAVLQSYPRSDVHGDGQVVVIIFSDGIIFEILPAIPKHSIYPQKTYSYPDTHMGGRWLSTNPKAEQEAMRIKNETSNGLLYDTCKHLRFIRDNFFPNNHISGIVIDSFVYKAIGGWSWSEPGAIGTAKPGEYERMLLQQYSLLSAHGRFAFVLQAPGSGDYVTTTDSIIGLGKVLAKIVEV